MKIKGYIRQPKNSILSHFQFMPSSKERISIFISQQIYINGVPLTAAEGCSDYGSDAFKSRTAIGTKIKAYFCANE